MKKSNWILLGVLCTIFLFFTVFQFSIHSYIRKGISEEGVTKNDEEVHVLLFEKLNTAHTGKVQHERTQTEYPKI